MTLDTGTSSGSLGLFRGPSTRERVLFHGAAAFSLLAAPLVALSALFWWPAAAAQPQEEARYRRRWLRAALLLMAIDVCLLGGLSVRTLVDGTWGATIAARPGGPAFFGVRARAWDGALVVDRALPGTAAGEAGLEAGDEITALDASPVDSLHGFQAILARHGPGDRLDVTFSRGGKVERRTVRITAEPEYLAAAREGWAALGSGETERAREEFERARDLYPAPEGNPDALAGLARVSELAGDLGQAAEHLEEALRSAAPGERDRLRVARTRIAYQSGRAEEAAKWLSQIEDQQFSRPLEPSVLALGGKSREAWVSWFRLISTQPAVLSALVAVIVLGLLAFLKRSVREAVVLFALGAGVLAGSVLVMLGVTAAYGFWAQGSPFLSGMHLSGMHSPDRTGVVLAATSGSAALVALTLLAHRCSPAQPPAPLGWRLANPSSLPRNVIAGLCLIYGTVMRIQVLSLIARGSGEGSRPSAHPLMELAGQDPRLDWWLLPTVSLLAPLAEEIYVRGFLHVRLRTCLSPGGAVAGTAVFFGLLHPVGIEYVLATAGLGLVLGYLRERTGSLVPPFCAHAALNGINWTLAATLRG